MKTWAKVQLRADSRCEYCLLPEAFAIFSFEIDHIIATKHGGKTILKNLAFPCIKCNRHKGSDLTTILSNEEIPVRLFNLRKERWSAHFKLKNGKYWV